MFRQETKISNWHNGNKELNNLVFIWLVSIGLIEKMRPVDIQERLTARVKASWSVLVHSKNKKEANVIAAAIARKRVVWGEVKQRTRRQIIQYRGGHQKKSGFYSEWSTSNCRALNSWVVWSDLNFEENLY